MFAGEVHILDMYRIKVTNFSFDGMPPRTSKNPLHAAIVFPCVK